MILILIESTRPRLRNTNTANEFRNYRKNLIAKCVLL